MSTVLVTGVAGFVGSHVAKRLLAMGHTVVGVDNFSINNPALQDGRLAFVGEQLEFHKLDLCDVAALESLFHAHTFDAVVHLAAKPGVRGPADDPFVYGGNNYMATLNVFECARRSGVEHTMFASSSSVYGANTKVPFSEDDRTDQPMSVYASTKKACELLAYTHHSLYGMNITGLRFFNVYGPYGRPDMAPWIFTQKITDGKTIDLFNYGEHERDWTYIDDVVDGCIGALENPQGFSVLNLGNQTPVKTIAMIRIMEEILKKKADLNMLPGKPGEVPITFADTRKANQLFGYEPNTSLEEGLRRFIEWYREYTAR